MTDDPLTRRSPPVPDPPALPPDGICSLAGHPRLIHDAAEILVQAFSGIGKDAWPTLPKALEEVHECLTDERIALGMLHRKTLAGWIGLRPLYPAVWEIHPVAVSPHFQRQGFGRQLLSAAEEQARRRGVGGLLLGTDDETGATSLSQTHLTPENLFSAISSLKNLRNHPYEFYRSCGYTVIGVVPDASGPRRPDILMWKRIESNP